eukprot:11785536-Heterocapsa_arctica.AAC.1
MDEEDVTAEQYSALRHLLTTNRVPYADFAVFGPFGSRIRRKTKFSGMMISAGGVLERTELLGPS